MFRSCDHHLEAALFLAKITLLKTILCVCIGWCTSQVILRHAQCNGKDFYMQIKFVDK